MLIIVVKCRVALFATLCFYNNEYYQQYGLKNSLIDFILSTFKFVRDKYTASVYKVYNFSRLYHKIFEKV